MQRFQTEIVTFLALLISNAIILFIDTPILADWPSFLAAITLTFILPGLAWLPILNWLQTNRAIERIVLIGGLSSLLSAFVLLVVVFLPGPFVEFPVIVGLNLISLLGLITQIIKRLRNPASDQPAIKLEWPSRSILFILIAIIAVAAVTRLTRFSYPEFHEDELENMRLIVRAYKGEEYAPFLDSKGPIHWLLPAALWYLNGWLNEGVARTPFVITGLLLVPLMYSLGRRMSQGNDAIGLIAAAFVGLNGFFVAYARHVENQSLIVFWGALAMWFAYRAYQEKNYYFQMFVALALAIGLIAHPDMLLYLPVFGYIVGLQLWQQRTIWAVQWRWFVLAGILFIGLVAFFYVPYLFDPNIGAVYQYFSDDRVGTSLFYNRVPNLFDQDQLYSTQYHAPVLILLLFWLLLRNFTQWGWRGWLLLGVVMLAIISTVQWSTVWQIGDINLAFVPYALLTLLVLILPRTNFETKTLFLWLSAPLGALLFLAKDAADHIQVAYTAWALLAAFGLFDLWRFLGTQSASSYLSQVPPPVATGITSSHPTTRLAPIFRTILVISLSVLVGLILFYQYLAFSTTVFNYWQIKWASVDNPDSIYNRLYGSIPRPRKIFSNPRLSGWKAVGFLWETGQLNGDFRSINDSFAVPIWYTFQTPRSCYEDPQHYWVRRGWQGWPEKEEDLPEQGYTLTQIVLVDQEEKLRLYEKGATVATPEILDMEHYRRQFDRLATPSRFAQEITGDQKTALNFGGDRLRLTSYDFPSTSVAPDTLLNITLFWETLAPMDVRYRAFIHLLDDNRQMWGQHDDDPACRLLTTDMRPGQKSSRQFRIPVSPDIPPGSYTLHLGLYNPNTQERLEIWDATAERNIGNHFILGEVEIE